MRQYYSIVIVLMMLTVVSSMESFAQTSAPSLKSINPVSLKFVKSNGKPVDFKIGLAIAEASDIRVVVNEAYELSEVKVFLARGKWPVTSNTYQSQSNEVLIEWKDFTNAQPGDRLCIDISIIKERQGAERIPVQLDVPVFNIPLN